MASAPLPSPASIRCKGILFDIEGILILSIGSAEPGNAIPERDLAR